MKNRNNAWVGTADKNNDPKFNELATEEFVGLPIAETLSSETGIDTSSNRRDFLKYLGFGLGAATIAAGCETPLRRAIPYVEKPDAIVPGVATYYATSFVNGGDYASILVKTREGRPIKIEGNSLSSVSQGGTGARGQAMVLSLYDSERLKNAGKVADGAVTEMSWAELDREIGGKLSAGSQIRIVTHTVLSPTTKRVFQEFKNRYPNTEIVTYDPISSSALLEANESCFGLGVVPNYRFDNAQVILSFGADFMGTWISPEEYSIQYMKNRRIKDVKNPKMSRHIQVESGMSLTGSNADNRVRIRPSEMGGAIALLLNELGGGVSAPKINDKATAAIKKLALELQANIGKCLVVCGTNNVAHQVLVNKINDVLGSYGNTIKFDAPSYQRQGRDKNIRDLVRDMNAGSVDAVFVWNANPAYDIPDADKFKTGLAKVGTTVSFSTNMDETTALCGYVAPNHHNLESWGDAEPKKGHYSIIQPTISPLFNTRQAEETLLKWSGNNASYYDYLQSSWQSDMMAQQSSFLSFQAFWDNAVHDGVFEVASSNPAVVFNGNVSGAASQIKKPSTGLEVAFYETVNIGSGQYANNPWLQEMPDPIMRTVWGNYLSVPVEWDESSSQFIGKNNTGTKLVYGVADIVDLSVGNFKEPFTTIQQFGQDANTVSVGLGFGREVVGKAGQNVGKNVFPCLKIDENGNTQYYSEGSISEIIGKNREFGCVQYHHTFGVTGEHEGEEVKLDEVALSSLITDGYQGSLTDRTILFNSNLDGVDGLVKDIAKMKKVADHRNDATLYPYKEYQEEFYSQGHHWAIHVDMNACYGCGACTVACMAENNVPVVGNREVARHHEMTWLRIDRYFYGDAENPNTVYMPMMCQHCDNAPCENVCPVNATNHSSEGLNQMTYNRCVGTRYCANNCPYKVRRFNWLDYTSADLFGGNQNAINGEDPAYYTDNLVRMVLNPDVTVRSRGVIEKCSFCVQRIQQGKLTAKAEGRKLTDRDVTSACASACPTGAITFGDTNNKKGDLGQAIESPLVYRVFEEIGVQSSVFYQAKVINKKEGLDA